MNGRHVAIALLLLSGCRQTRCVEPSVDCLDVAVDTRDAGGGVTAIRIVDFSSTPSCTQDLRLYCQIGVWDGALNEGTFRNFYFDATTAGTVSDPFGAEEFFLEPERVFGISCVNLDPEDAADVASCVNADCGVPTAEEKALDAASEADECRTGGFFIPFTIGG